MIITNSRFLLDGAIPSHVPAWTSEVASIFCTHQCVLVLELSRKGLLERGKKRVTLADCGLYVFIFPCTAVLPERMGAGALALCVSTDM